MAKLQKTKAEVVAAIRRKSAFSLPNNPTAAGWTPNEIRDTLYRPIVDISASVLAELDRLAEELSELLGKHSIDRIEAVSGSIYTGSFGIRYTKGANGFRAASREGVEGDLILPSYIFFDGAYYPLLSIEEGAFSDCGITSVWIPDTVSFVGAFAFRGCESLLQVLFEGAATVGTGAFPPNATVRVPREHLAAFAASLGTFGGTVEGYDTAVSNAESLAGIEDDMESGAAATKLKLYASASATVLSTLQEVVSSLQSQVSSNNEDITALADGKLSKVESVTPDRRIYTVGKTGQQEMLSVAEAPSDGRVPLYRDGGNLAVDTPTQMSHAANKRYVDVLARGLAAQTEVNLDPNTYVLTVKLKNRDGELIAYSTIDLPLESMKMGASYNNGVLTLSIRPTEGNTPQTVDVNISDLISGLVNTTAFESGIEALEERIGRGMEALLLDVQDENREHLAAMRAENAEQLEMIGSLLDGARQIMSNEDNGKHYTYQFFVRDGHFGIRTNEII